MKVRTEARREAIVAEAKRLFLELGYERATMTELTRRLGGSKATVYGYFSSKQELFIAVTQAMAETHLEGAMAELQTLAYGNIETGLMKFGSRLIQLLSDDESIAMQRVTISESGRSEVGNIVAEFGPGRCKNVLSNAFQDAMNLGKMERGPADVLATQFLGLVQSEILLRTFLRHPPRLKAAEIHAMAGRAVRLFLHGYRAVAIPSEAT
jgi:AcrR family transcriptional regulator